jgi:hypothetical protein
MMMVPLTAARNDEAAGLPHRELPHGRRHRRHYRGVDDALHARSADAELAVHAGVGGGNTSASWSRLPSAPALSSAAARQVAEAQSGASGFRSW